MHAISASNLSPLRVINKMQSLFLFPSCCLCLQPLGFLPVVTVGLNQLGRLNLGRQVSSLQYFPVCGQQEGYQPFAVNMSRDPTLWMSWKQPQFTPITPDCHNLQVKTTACRFPLALSLISFLSVAHMPGINVLVGFDG